MEKGQQKPRNIYLLEAKNKLKKNNVHLITSLSEKKKIMCKTGNRTP